MYVEETYDETKMCIKTNLKKVDRQVFKVKLITHGVLDAGRFFVCKLKPISN